MRNFFVILLKSLNFLISFFVNIFLFRPFENGNELCVRVCFSFFVFRAGTLLVMIRTTLKSSEHFFLVSRKTSLNFLIFDLNSSE